MATFFGLVSTFFEGLVGNFRVGFLVGLRVGAGVTTTGAGDAGGGEAGTATA